MEIITFKLPDQLAETLRQKAEQWHNASLHKFAKQIVVNYLEDTERARIRQEVFELRREITRLREDMANVVTVLLVKAGKTNPQEANEWVERNLPSS